ncbi:hypothetical protein BIV57_16140 [Mangrovactinospora gilvigrisea]|uniref:Transmembrane protein n=1 Tax=Mangrovactinospora gilvigrisea TaxID=1428644 RepID=A0A1J7C4F5_9ACTN|nr:hypothetical protein BIV57_16140 [Mangrovactinospora gilvigrisea]
MEAGPHSEPQVDDEEPLTPPHAFRELRPRRRLSIWHLAPIVAVAVLGSLMFAFPLAFNGGSSDLLVAVSGLVITGGAAVWGVVASYRAGHSWPGLPRRSEGGPGGTATRAARFGRRALFGYGAGLAAVIALAVLRLVSLTT